MPTRFVGWFADPVPSEVDGIASSGANAVSMGPYCVMEGWSDPNVGVVNGTNAQFTGAIREARAKGLLVVLKPIVDCRSYAGDPDEAGWRAAINPRNISAWMEDYWTNCFKPYVALVDAVAVHTELATISALYPNNVIELIQEIRMAGFWGPLTTSHDFNPLGCPYWTSLDWIGGDAYPTIRSDSMAHAVADWIPLAQAAAVANSQTGCNVYFGEFCPNIGATMTAAQTSVVYDAFWEVFGPLEYWSGVGAWRWPQNGSTPGARLTSGLVSGLARSGTYTTTQAKSS